VNDPNDPQLELGDLDTEARHPHSAGLESRSTASQVQLLLADQAAAIAAARACSAQLERLIEEGVRRLSSGGRLIYAGAGTSGRLGVLDASECPPTFGAEPDQVQACIAGGELALRHASEGAEDDPEAGVRAMAHVECSAADLVVGIAASGRTPFVLGALQYARTLGAYTAAICCVRQPAAAEHADLVLCAPTAAELVTGSTRLKAGTATKALLNTLTTGIFIGLGHTRDGRMVRLRATNFKLRDRCLRILGELCGLDRPAAARLLDRADGDLRRALDLHEGKA
jgi:N-acetylmuramic acid 6-phosphate etherase